MSTLFDEAEADAEVTRVLTNEISKLRSYLMPIVKTTEGKFYRVEAEQEVSADDVQAKATELQAEVTELTALLAPVEAPAPTTDTTQDMTSGAPVGGSPVETPSDTDAPAEPTQTDAEAEAGTPAVPAPADVTAAPDETPPLQ